MNPIDPDRGDLLEDLFSKSSSPPLNELLTAIHREKLRRESRQRALALGTSLVVLFAVAMFQSRLLVPAPVPKGAEANTGGMRADLASEPFRVERLDDEGLLKLLDKTPVAMVRWPNGQRALMLMVRTSVPD